MTEDKIVIKKRTIQIVVVVILAVVILALIGVLIWRAKQVSDAKKMVGSVTPSVQTTRSATKSTVTIKGTSSVIATTTASATDEEIIFGRAKNAASNFMTAYINRSLDQAKPYMTTGYYNSTNEADFAGVSSPSRDHYAFTSDVSAGADVYQINVKVYLKLNGEDSGSENFRLNILPEGGVDGTYLVDSMLAI